MERKAQSEKPLENENISELEEYESPQVTLCDIKDTSNGGSIYIDGTSTQS